MIKSTITERLSRLRNLMKQNDISAVIVPTGDYHMSEYCADFFRSREFITGFTGSAGTAVITLNGAGLWTDSRYYLQAIHQLEGTGIRLFKQLEPGEQALEDYILSELSEGQTIAFDGTVVSLGQSNRWQEVFTASGLVINSDIDLIGMIWETRPSLSCNPVYDYEIKYAGQCREEKISLIREDMQNAGADALLISSLSDIAWLLNLRGSDVHCNPVFLSFLMMTQDNVTLFAQRQAFSDDLTGKLSSAGVELAVYEDIYEALSFIPDGSSLWISPADTNCRLASCIPEMIRLIESPSPTSLRKAVKNSIEQECAKAAHIRDGVAVTKWIYWLKKNIGKVNITEISAAEKLYSLRSEQRDFIGNSFDPIIGYGPHAAIVHYSASEESDVYLEPHGLVLADTGGQYLDGTTDITRTIALGPVSEEERMMFTSVLRGHIALAMAIFKDGCNGHNLDILAHLPLWMMGKDYGHGTGHGVGHFLNVHELPNHFHWDMNGTRGLCPALRPGMITSDEPGYYEEGKFGIRHESLLLCVEKFENEHGKFLGHEEITMVPFDLDAINADMLTFEEKEYLNSYHQLVYRTISPFLDMEESEWLKCATKSI